MGFGGITSNVELEIKQMRQLCMAGAFVYFLYSTGLVLGSLYIFICR